jgi:solute:Na+ symporter, SSS family
MGAIGVLAWTVGMAIGYGGDTAPMAGAMEGQRILSCRNGREAAKMYVWTEVVLFLVLALQTLPALGAMVKWPGLYDGTINKELSYGMLLAHYLPSGLLGVAISGMLAALMSTVSSHMNFGAQVFLNDLYQRLVVPRASQRHYLIVGRVVAAAIVLLGIVVATRAQNIIDISIFMLGLSSAELTANWGQWWWWRFNGAARLTASFGGPLVFLLNKYVVFQYVIDGGPDATYLVVLSSIAATCVLWIVVALLTKPDSEDVLIAFYREARPMGWWGPIARKAAISPTGVRPIFRGLGIAALGAIMVGAGVLLLSCLYVGRWDSAACAAVAFVVSGLLFKATFARYMESVFGNAEQNRASNSCPPHE